MKITFIYKNYILSNNYFFYKKYKKLFNKNNLSQNNFNFFKIKCNTYQVSKVLFIELIKQIYNQNCIYFDEHSLAALLKPLATVQSLLCLSLIHI